MDKSHFKSPALIETLRKYLAPISYLREKASFEA